MDDLSNRAHHALGLARLEKLDDLERRLRVREQPLQILGLGRRRLPARRFERARGVAARQRQLDRKSTRLNSSHLVISYAVFCLKKKTSNSTLPTTLERRLRRLPTHQPSASDPS